MRWKLPGLWQDNVNPCLRGQEGGMEEKGTLAGGLRWPGAGGDNIKEETAYAPSPALSLLMPPPCPRPWMRLWFLSFGPNGRDLSLGAQGQRPRSSTHHLSCPHQTPDPVFMALLASGSFWGDLVRSRWLKACGAVACSLLIFPLSQSDSPKIWPLQSLGIREGLSPCLPLRSYHHP